MLSPIMQTIPPINSILVRTNPLMHCITKFCSCVISFVTLVIREPVENLSVCSKEKDIILLNVSFLTSLPNCCAERLANTPDITPHTPPAATKSTILIPVPSMISRFPTPPLLIPSTPSSIIWLISSGWIRSMLTSPIIKSGASIVNNQYFFKYLSIFSLLFRIVVGKSPCFDTYGLLHCYAIPSIIEHLKFP